jgi:DNA polymerase
MEIRQRIDNLKTIANDISFCNRCPLCDSRTNTCPGNTLITPEAKQFKYMLIGEAPGQQEDESGKVFVGKSGQLLKEAITTIDLKDFFITNMIKCRPPENRNPNKEEIVSCSQWLLDQIDAASPRIIIAVGNVSFKSLTKWFKEESYFQQKPHFKLEKIYHPSYISRNGGKSGKLYHEWLNNINEIKTKWSHL